MRAMGGLREEIPFTFWMMMIGTLALTGVGVPFTSIGFAGYVSKDAIIEAAYASHGAASGYAFFCVVAAAALTSFYSWRLIFMTFFGKRGDWAAQPAAAARGPDPSHGHGEAHSAHESPVVMLVPLAALALGATVAGVAFRPWFIGAGFADFWKHALFIGPDNTIVEEMENVPWLVSLSPTLMMAGGFLVALYMYVVNRAAPKALADAVPGLYRFMLNKWWFDELYDFLFVRPAFRLGRLFWKGGDGFLIDGFGPDGISARVLDAARGAVRLQTGYVYHYAFAMLIGVALFATWYLFGGLR
jgi:NADH-quinone oxidoreductase subunit L